MYKKEKEDKDEAFYHKIGLFTYLQHSPSSW